MFLYLIASNVHCLVIKYTYLLSFTHLFYFSGIQVNKAKLFQQRCLRIEMRTPISKCGTAVQNKLTINFLPWRKKLKNQILSSSLHSDCFTKEYKQLLYVLERTIKYGESDSALIIGFKGVGKTTVSEKN